MLKNFYFHLLSFPKFSITILASNTAIDDVTYYVTHRMLNTSL